MKDTWNVCVRELRPLLRDPFSLIFSLVQPLVFLGIFGPLLVGQSGQPAGETLRWFVPGVLVMIVLFGSGATGSNLLYDMMSGAHERTLVAPLSRSSLLIGRACKELLPTVSGFILGVILLAIFGVGLGALSYALALASKNHDWLFWGVQQTLIFPLLILSGLLIPLDYGPQWMRTAATINPANWLVQALRILLDQGLTSDQAILYGVLSAVTLAGVGIAVGIAAINRE